MESKSSWKYIESPNKRVGRRKPCTVLVQHYTAGGNINQTAKYFQQASSEVSAHFLVGRDGEILAVRHNYELDDKGVHAEFVAILDVIKNFHGRKNRRRLYGAHLTVAARRKKSGNIISARPCERIKPHAQSISTVPCMTLAKLVGIKKIEYTTKDGSWATKTF